MLWLVGTKDQPRQCKLMELGECTRVIASESPEPVAMQSLEKNDRSKGYRTRSDKQFCSKEHNNRYHYLTKIKPRRQQQRQRRD
jgi:hypothetical protein